MGISGHEKNESPEHEKEKQKLREKKNRLKSNIEELRKQFDFMKNISIGINEKTPKNNYNYNMRCNSTNNNNFNYINGGNPCMFNNIQNPLMYSNNFNNINCINNNMLLPNHNHQQFQQISSDVIK
jgi:hypothetical protein